MAQHDDKTVVNCFCKTIASARLWLYLKRLYFISSAIAYCISPYASFYAGLSYKITGSTTAAIIDITYIVSMLLETNKFVRCLLIDFPKAFDSVDHIILINKLKSLNISDVIQWVVSFLTDRAQFVKMGQKWWFTCVINRSIVQGSDIGPTLFVICIIDLKPIGSTNYVTKYADDASLLVPEKCDNDITLEFQNVLKWAINNKLTINMAKIKELVFHWPNARNYLPPV